MGDTRTCEAVGGNVMKSGKGTKLGSEVEKPRGQKVMDDMGHGTGMTGTNWALVFHRRCGSFSGMAGEHEKKRQVEPGGFPLHRLKVTRVRRN